MIHIIERPEPLAGSCRNINCWRECPKGGYCNVCSKRRQRARNIYRYYWENLKQSASRRDIPFDLPLEEFCDWLRENNYQPDTGFSTDRINDDPRKGPYGYHMGNIEATTVSENARKWLRWNRLKKRAEPERFQPLESGKEQEVNEWLEQNLTRIRGQEEQEDIF